LVEEILLGRSYRIKPSVILEDLIPNPKKSMIMIMIMILHEYITTTTTTVVVEVAECMEVAKVFERQNKYDCSHGNDGRRIEIVSM